MSASADLATPHSEQHKRRQIIDAALKVFAEHGLHGVSVPTIAAQADVSVGTLYRYFRSKEALINAVFRDAKNALQEQLLNGLDLMHPSRTLFNALWQRLTDFARNHPHAFQFLEMQDHHSYLNAESRSVEQGLLIPLGLMVIIGQRTGLISDHLRPDLAIALFWGSFVGIFKAERLGYLKLTDDDLQRARDACWLGLTQQPESAS